MLRTPRKAFTLIELLVVIAIIALLIGILLPTLGAAKKQAGTVRELASLRTMLSAYFGYAEDHADAVLPGYADAQGLLDDRGLPIPNGAGFDEIRKRYPWRILPYLDYQIAGSVLVGSQQRFLDRRSDLSDFEFYYGISVYPNFGLNTRFLGGDPRAAPAAFFKPTKRWSDPLLPSELMVFASAKGATPFEELVNGYFYVVPPATPAHTPGAPAEANGFLDPRAGGKTLIGLLDGHVRSAADAELRDTRLWSDYARRTNASNWLR